MTFERTFDWDKIKEIVTDESVYRHIQDDFSPSPEDWQPLQDESIWYVIAREGEEIYGLFALIPENKICWKAHPCLLPNTFGYLSRLITQQFIEWLWDNSPCLRLIAEVPETNQIVKKYAMDAGMTQFGVNEKSLMKGGKLQNQVLYGISKPKDKVWA